MAARVIMTWINRSAGSSQKHAPWCESFPMSVRVSRRVWGVFLALGCSLIAGACGSNRTNGFTDAGPDDGGTVGADSGSSSGGSSSSSSSGSSLFDRDRQRGLEPLRFRRGRRQRGNDDREHHGDRPERHDADGHGRPRTAHDLLLAVGGQPQGPRRRQLRRARRGAGSNRWRAARPALLQQRLREGRRLPPRVERAGDRLPVQRARVPPDGRPRRQGLGPLPGPRRVHGPLPAYAGRHRLLRVLQRRVAAPPEHRVDRELSHHRPREPGLHQHVRRHHGDRRQHDRQDEGLERGQGAGVDRCGRRRRRRGWRARSRRCSRAIPTRAWRPP
jgi:hypothetical protein